MQKAEVVEATLKENNRIMDNWHNMMYHLDGNDMLRPRDVTFQTSVIELLSDIHVLLACLYGVSLADMEAENETNNKRDA